MASLIRSWMALGILTVVCFAQQPPAPWDRNPGRRGPPGGPPRGRTGLSVPPGKWWNDPRFVQMLSLTSDQRKKIEDVFQQSRLKLIDLSASLEKEEAILDPLLNAEHPDDAKILAQIDRVAQARAELEKANARMLVGFRNALTQEQWAKLQMESSPPPRRAFH